MLFVQCRPSSIIWTWTGMRGRHTAHDVSSSPVHSFCWPLHPSLPSDRLLYPGSQGHISGLYPLISLVTCWAYFLLNTSPINIQLPLLCFYFLQACIQRWQFMQHFIYYTSVPTSMNQQQPILISRAYMHAHTYLDQYGQEPHNLPASLLSKEETCTSTERISKLHAVSWP